MARYRVYRGFNNVEEAFLALRNKTVGGDPENSLTGDKDDKAVHLRKVKQKGTDGEGQVRITEKKAGKDRQGVIEYTLNLGTARNFGILCVIGGLVELPEDKYTKEYWSLVNRDPEMGVFMRTDLHIEIVTFEIRALDNQLGTYNPSGAGMGLGFGFLSSMSGPKAVTPSFGSGSGSVLKSVPKGKESGLGYGPVTEHNPTGKDLIKLFIGMICKDAATMALVNSSYPHFINKAKIGNYID